VHRGSGAQQDREVRHKTVEAVPSTALRAGLAEAALANAQLAVAKAVLKAEFRRVGANVEETAATTALVDKLPLPGSEGDTNDRMLAPDRGFDTSLCDAPLIGQNADIDANLQFLH
jgi:hypothetical protein